MLVIKHILCLSSYIKVSTKVPSSKMKAMAAYSDKRHIAVSDEDMSRKWGIGLDKAKLTLDATTQMNFRSAIFTQTKRYRTDILS